MHDHEREKCADEIRSPGILAVGFARHGTEEQLKADAITHLYNVYVQVNKEGSAQVPRNPEDIPEGETDAQREDAEKKQPLTEAATATHDEARAFFRKMEDSA